MFRPQHFPVRGSQYLWYDIMQIKISWDIYPKGYWSCKMFYLPLRSWIEINGMCFIYWIKRITLSYRAHTVILKDIQKILKYFWCFQNFLSDVKLEYFEYLSPWMWLAFCIYVARRRSYSIYFHKNEKSYVKMTILIHFQSRRHQRNHSSIDEPKSFFLYKFFSKIMKILEFILYCVILFILICETFKKTFVPATNFFSNSTLKEN